MKYPHYSPYGGAHILRFTTSTHDEHGQLTKNPEKVRKLNERLAAKVEAHLDEIAMVKADLQPGAETLVISYGVTTRAVEEAVHTAREKGRLVSSLTVYSLWPVPEKEIRAALAGIRKVIVPELNLGQYRLEVERLVPDGVEVMGINRVDGELISPEEILDQGGLAMSDQPMTTYLDETLLPYFFCPGCGHGMITNHLNAALVKLQLDPHKVVIVTDIGCSGLADKYFTTNAFHGLHGRSVTYATGIKLANPELKVIVLMGDGGCGIGGHHLINAARRNIGVTVVVFNNFNYGMTGGEHSVTTPAGRIDQLDPTWAAGAPDGYLPDGGSERSQLCRPDDFIR